jgi:acetyl esterase
VVSFVQEFPGHARLGRDYLLTQRSMQAFAAMAMPDDARRADPRYNFLDRGDMGHCPPVMLLTAGYDPLGDEGQALADRLSADGVAVTHRQCPTLIHAFIHMTGVTEAIQPLLKQAAEWCRQAAATPYPEP